MQFYRIVYTMSEMSRAAEPDGEPDEGFTDKRLNVILNELELQFLSSGISRDDLVLLKQHLTKNCMI